MPDRYEERKIYSYSEALQKHLESEVRFLKEIKECDGVTLNQANLITSRVGFGTGIDVIYVLTKFLNLGFIKYQRDINKFVAVKLEENKL